MANEKGITTQDNDLTAGSAGRQNQSPAIGAAPVDKNVDKQSTEEVKTSAKDILSKAKDSASQAYGMAADKATSKIEEQKTNLSSGLSGVADSLRQVGQTLRDTDEPNVVTNLTAKYGESIAQQLEKVSDYFENQDLQTIIRDVEDFARRQPAIFIGAAFAAGLLTARFLKSSSASGSQQPRKLIGGSADKQNFNNQTQTGQTAVNAS